MVFTLMSVGTMDQAGYSLHIKEGKCKIKMPKSTIITQIPLVVEGNLVYWWFVDEGRHVARDKIKEVTKIGEWGTTGSSNLACNLLLGE
jgi:hypothetical protein